MDLGPGSIFIQQAVVKHACADGEWSQGRQPGKRRLADNLIRAFVHVPAIQASAMTEAVSTQYSGELDISRSIKVQKS